VHTSVAISHHRYSSHAARRGTRVIAHLRVIAPDAVARRVQAHVDALRADREVAARRAAIRRRRRLRQDRVITHTHAHTHTHVQWAAASATVSAAASARASATASAHYAINAQHHTRSHHAHSHTAWETAWARASVLAMETNCHRVSVVTHAHNTPASGRVTVPVSAPAARAQSHSDSCHNSAHVPRAQALVEDSALVSACNNNQHITCRRCARTAALAAVTAAESAAASAHWREHDHAQPNTFASRTASGTVLASASASPLGKHHPAFRINQSSIRARTSHITPGQCQRHHRLHWRLQHTSARHRTTSSRASDAAL
jgi:hypothetical protein